MLRGMSLFGIWERYAYNNDDTVYNPAKWELWISRTSLELALINYTTEKPNKWIFAHC